MIRDLKWLQQRLSKLDADYKRLPEQDDTVKRQAALYALALVDRFLRARPDWRQEHWQPLGRIAEALATVDRGRRVSWLEPGAKTSSATTMRIACKRAGVAGVMDALMFPTDGARPLSRKEATWVVHRTIVKSGKRGRGLFGLSKKPSPRQVSDWYDAVTKKDPKSAEGRAFNAARVKRTRTASSKCSYRLPPG
jgi:hypothetical protein